MTGGAGFLGSHLCDRLLEEGHDVVCVDNFFSSTRANIYRLMDNPRIEVIRRDITFPIYIEVDEIYHLACPASPIPYQRDPVQTIKTAVHGSINMLGLAKRTRSRIVPTSTSQVYGDPAVHPQPETYCGSVYPIGPRTCSARAPWDRGAKMTTQSHIDYKWSHWLSPSFSDLTASKFRVP